MFFFHKASGCIWVPNNSLAANVEDSNLSTLSTWIWDVGTHVALSGFHQGSGNMTPTETSCTFFWKKKIKITIHFCIKISISLQKCVPFNRGEPNPYSFSTAHPFFSTPPGGFFRVEKKWLPLRIPDSKH